MKKLLLSTFALSGCLWVNAQCTDLFFSKYLSNGSNNKALEIYNPTSAPIVLTGKYYVARYKTPTSGGNASGPVPTVYNDTVWLRGSIPAYGTFVLANPEVSPNSSNANAVDDIRIRNKAVGTGSNGQLGNIYGTYGTTVGDPTYFKGSDVLTIEKKVGTTITIVDLFGRQGDYMAASNGKPSAWSTIAPYTGGTGMGWWITKGYLMVRKHTIKTGVTTNPSAFNPLADWDTITTCISSVDTAALYNRLGSHTCDCNTTGISEQSNSVISSAFPSPVGNSNRVTINSSEPIKSYAVISITGAIVREEQIVQAKKSFILNVDQLPKGLYFVSIKHISGKSSITRFIKN